MNKIRFTSLTASLVLAITFTISCEDKDPNSFKDSRDGKTYKKVTIGSQTWMTENLNFAAEGSKCYDNKPENCEKYGRLYDWETAMKACPSGWHLPSNDEYEVLVNAVGGDEVAGKKLKSSSGWENDGNGTDEYGFSALPGGDGPSDGSFYRVGIYGGWWSASEDEFKDGDYSDNAYLRLMGYDSERANLSSNFELDLYSVRCLQD
jgi:uncharacterized protein (TIGR02145 family)